jgi:hypothetical protein
MRVVGPVPSARVCPADPDGRLGDGGAHGVGSVLVDDDQ